MSRSGVWECLHALFRNQSGQKPKVDVMRRLTSYCFAIFAALVVMSPAVRAELVGYWDYDENGGTQLLDSSGNDLHGAFVGSPTWVPGRSGAAGDYALSLGGSDYVNLSNPPELAIAGDQTIVMWVRPTNMDNRHGPYGKAYGGSGAITVFRDRERSPAGDGVANLIYLCGNSGENKSEPSYQTIARPVTIDQWSFIAVTRDLETVAGDGRLKLYLNGGMSSSTPKYTSPDGTNPVVTGTLNAYLGRTYNGNWRGLIDDSAIWDEALDTDQVRSIYTLNTDLGLPYQIGDVMALWDIHDSQGAGLIGETPWLYRSSLPGSPSPGDAYVYDGIRYLALGDGTTGLAALPEPSTCILATLGLLSLAFCGRRRRR